MSCSSGSSRSRHPNAQLRIAPRCNASSRIVGKIRLKVSAGTPGCRDSVPKSKYLAHAQRSLGSVYGLGCGKIGQPIGGRKTLRTSCL